MLILLFVSCFQLNLRTGQSSYVVYKNCNLINLYLQRFQNKVLRNMVNAPWYIRNNDNHRDLQVYVMTSEIQRFAQKHEERLHHDENFEAIQSWTIWA